MIVRSANLGPSISCDYFACGTIEDDKGGDTLNLKLLGQLGLKVIQSYIEISMDLQWVIQTVWFMLYPPSPIDLAH